MLDAKAVFAWQDIARTEIVPEEHAAIGRVGVGVGE